MCVHSSLCRSPASVCATVNGPLAKAGTAVTCDAKRPSGFNPLPKKGRYVIIELSSSVKGAKSQLAASEVVVFGRGELQRARERAAVQGRWHLMRQPLCAHFWRFTGRLNASCACYASLVQRPSEVAQRAQHGVLAGAAHAAAAS